MDRAQEYLAVRAQLAAVLEECREPVAAMASAAALLKERFPAFSWVGFYLPEPDGTLLVGPYQGPLACLRLAPGRGVCGAAYTSGETQVVADVEAFPGHIACDPTSRSEVVVPIRQGSGPVLAVLDVDSREPGAFSAADREGLEGVATLMADVLACKESSRNS